MDYATTKPDGISPRAHKLLAVGIFFLVADALVLGLRFMSRYMKRNPFGWDDWLCLGGYVFFCWQVGLHFYAIYGAGVGFHTYQVTPQMAQNMLWELTIIQYPYAFDLSAIRFSILALFLRIFPQKWMRMCLYTGIALNIAWSIFVVIATVPVCIPFSWNWDQSTPGGHCNNTAKLNTYIANAVWTIIMDFAIWALPQFTVWRLNMPVAKKVALSFVFALGILDIIISIIRINTVVQVDFSDLTFAGFPAQVWTLTEVGVAIIVACLPVCGHFFTVTVARPFLNKSKGSGVSTGDSSRTPQTIGSSRRNQKDSRSREVYSMLDDEEIALEMGHNPKGASEAKATSFNVHSPEAEAERASRTDSGEQAMNGINVSRKVSVTYVSKNLDTVRSENGVNKAPS